MLYILCLLLDWSFDGRLILMYRPNEAGHHVQRLTKGDGRAILSSSMMFTLAITMCVRKPNASLNVIEAHDAARLLSKLIGWSQRCACSK